MHGGRIRPRNSRLQEKVTIVLCYLAIAFSGRVLVFVQYVFINRQDSRNITTLYFTQFTLYRPPFPQCQCFFTTPSLCSRVKFVKLNFGTFHRNCSYQTGQEMLSCDFTVRAKVVRTQVHCDMSSPRSIQRYWSFEYFEYYFSKFVSSCDARCEKSHN